MLMAACARTTVGVIRTPWYLLEGYRNSVYAIWRKRDAGSREKVGWALLSFCMYLRISKTCWRVSGAPCPNLRDKEATVKKQDSPHGDQNP